MNAEQNVNRANSLITNALLSMNKRVVQFAIAFVIFIGCSVLLGWQFNLTLLKSGFFGSPATIKANAAFCFLLAGISLLLLQRRQPRWLLIATGCALLTASIGLLTLGQYLFGCNFGIDELLFQDVIASTAVYPGRMGQITAFNFVLVGCALLLLGKKTRSCDWFAQSLSCIAALTAAVALVGSLFEVNIFYHLLAATITTSPHTAVTFIVLCIGILFTRPNRGLMQTFTSSSLGGTVARRLLPWAFALPLGSNWLILEGLKFGEYDDSFTHALQTVSMICLLSILIWYHARLIDDIEIQRKHAEQERRESQRQFRRAVIDSPLPIMIHAEDGEVVQINHAWCEISGYQHEDIPTIADWTERAYKERKELIREVIDNIYSLDCQVAEGEYTINTRSGESRVWEVYSAPLGKTSDHRRLILSTAIDVTQRKQAEEALVQMNASLEKRVKKRTQDLANINRRLQSELKERQRVELELRSVSERLQYLLTATPAVIFSCKTGENYAATFMSENVAAVVGYKPQDFLGKFDFWLSRIHPEDVERVITGVRQILTTDSYSYEYRFLHANGTYCWLQEQIKLIRDEQGNPLEIVGYSADISEQQAALRERKALEMEVQQKQQLLNSFITCAPVGMAILDSQGRYSLINERLAEINGISPEDHISKTPWDIVPDVAPRLQKIFNYILTTGEPILNIEISGETQKLPGVVRHWLASYFPIFNHSNTPIGVGSVVADITARKAAEAALKESEERFQTFMNYSPTPAWITDAEGNVLYLSQTYFRTFDIPIDSVGKTVFDMYPADYAQQYLESIKKVAASNQVVEEIETAPRRDGTLGDYLVYKFPLQGFSGQNLVGGVAVDITERRRAELALQEREAMLRAIGDNLPNGAIYQSVRELDNSIAFYHLSAGIERITEIKAEAAFKNPSLLMNQVLEEDFPKFLEATEESMRNLSIFNIRVRIKTYSGLLKWLHFRGTPRSLDDGRIICDALVVDVTDLQLAEEALRLQAEKEKTLNKVIQAIRNSLDLQTIFNTAAAEIAKLVQADRAVILQYIPQKKLWQQVADFNPTPSLPDNLGEDILDHPNELTTRLKQLEIVQIDAPISLPNEINSKLAQTHSGAWLLVPLQINSRLWGSLSLVKNSQNTWQDSEIKLTLAVADQLTIAIGQSQLYQQLELVNQELERLATIDALTQVANRRRFDERLQQEWLRLTREGTPLSLVLCDVDYFKRYNDTYGHPAGDACLQQVAQAMSRAVKRSTDLVARYGGEEFAIILPNTDAQGAVRVVEAVQEEIRKLKIPHIASVVEQYVSLSLGIATTFPTGEHSAQALINAADSALYQAKQKGRNCFQSVSELGVRRRPGAQL